MEHDPLLVQRELEALLLILDESDATPDAITASFNRTFTKSDHFKVCCVISIMLVDRLLTRAQRIVAFSILCELYRNEANGTNPFLPFFLDALENGSDPCERQYLVHLLSSPPSHRESSRKSARALIEDFAAAERADPSIAQAGGVPELSALRRLYLERTPPTPNVHGGGAGLRPVIADPCRLVEDVGEWLPNQSKSAQVRSTDPRRRAAFSSTSGARARGSNACASHRGGPC
jgi:hypothetical protein